MTRTHAPTSVLPQEGEACTLLTGAEWILSAVGGPGALGVVHGAQCVTCAQTSVHSKDDRRSIGSWAVAHTRDNPLHQDYVKITRERWRVHPTTRLAAPDQAPAQLDSSSAPLPRDDSQQGPIDQGSGKRREVHSRHARQLSTRRLVLWAVVWGVGAWLGRGWSGVAKGGAWLRRRVAMWAGPLFLALLSTAVGFFLGAAFIQGMNGRG